MSIFTETEVKKKKIEVYIAELTQPIRTIVVEEGMHLEEFLQRNNIEYSSDIRVNSESESADYSLEDQDVVTIISEVSGGVK